MQHLTIHGRVQGVGYRAIAQRAATAAGIAGWVRNRDDGTVEAVLDASEPILAALLTVLHKGPALGRVDRIELRDADDAEIVAVTTPCAILPTATLPPCPTADTIAAYRATDYLASIDLQGGDRRRFRIDDPAATHADWLAAAGARHAVILTAWNPFGAATSPPDNDRAQATLAAAIQSAGLRHGPASGEDPRGLWQPEPGFVVLDADDRLVDRWLRSFRQNAAVRISREGPCQLVWHPDIRHRLADSRPA